MHPFLSRFYVFAPVLLWSGPLPHSPSRVLTQPFTKLSLTLFPPENQVSVCLSHEANILSCDRWQTEPLVT